MFRVFGCPSSARRPRGVPIVAHPLAFVAGGHDGGVRAEGPVRGELGPADPVMVEPTRASLEARQSETSGVQR